MKFYTAEKRAAAARRAAAAAGLDVLLPSPGSDLRLGAPRARAHQEGR